MPAPDLDRLHAGPEQLLGWLDNNVLLSGLVQNSASPNFLEWMTIGPPAPFNAPTGQKPDGTAIDVFYLRNNGTGPADAVRSYICNYVPNQVRSTPLGTGGDYCFTTTMNGCTFGVGRAAPDGSVRVSHANTGGDTAAQRNQTWTEHGNHNVSMLEPALYRRLGNGMNLNITTFGIRSGRAWKFYFQLFEARPGRVFVLHGVFPILAS